MSSQPRSWRGGLTESADAMANAQRERDAAIEERRRLLNEREALAVELAGSQSQASGCSHGTVAAIAERDRETRMVTLHREQRLAAEEELRTLRVRSRRRRSGSRSWRSCRSRPQAPDAGIRAVLEAGGLRKRELTTSEMELPGVIGRVGELVRPPRGLERAIEAALAENLHAVVFERETNLQSGVKLLVLNDFGRALSMYALYSLHESRPLHIIKERGVIGVASGLV